MAGIEEAKRCSKCGSSLDPGYILDVTHGGYKAAEWVEGPPERSFWVGLKVSDRSRYKICTFRCTSCGYLESYATEMAA
jgi:uncharacterized OB-fold protein